MQQSLTNTDMNEVLKGVTYLVSNSDIVTSMKEASPKRLLMMVLLNF